MMPTQAQPAHPIPHRSRKATMHHPFSLKLSVTLLAAATLAACSTVPTANSHLEQAQSDFRSAQADARSQSQAGSEMKQAQDTLNRAEAAWRDGKDASQVTHLAYLARQRVAIARETMTLKTAEQAVANAGTARGNIRLDARTREADAAQRSAVVAQGQAQASQRASEAARAETDEALRVTNAVIEQNRQLEARLRELNAQPTARGLVITLGDVLFDLDQAQLKPAGTRVVEQLVAVLRDYPLRTALIEGFTDSTGSDAYNQTLSARRAEAVRSAMLSQGIGRERITAKGYGEAFPVANNDQAEGRQLNRRVEIVLSNDSGLIMAR